MAPDNGIKAAYIAEMEHTADRIINGQEVSEEARNRLFGMIAKSVCQMASWEYMNRTEIEKVADCAAQAAVEMHVGSCPVVLVGRQTFKGALIESVTRCPIALSIAVLAWAIVQVVPVLAR